ncbi:sensor domain-containing diguanylate cyclase [Polynucleobacter sp. AP-Nino-20-G2]|uniref:bifunctional diguanylate cyclase/phosphodiesterase n=1 Tax=Polynucleobacter sp. AP-Nino-20-G2 TaxID=2576917 RepID=UPI001BFE8EBB|nr:sensor domain-containing diguanylate cyclase [Polynucleobacter sp. AP-Nino-20-G2]QWE17262.1 GGDEF domain-containing protein [Polynucleobacter sp. AP-Nino-20-G2]
MTISFESDSNIKRNTRLILLAAVALAAIFFINALVSTYLLRKNSIQDRADQLANLTIILAEHTSQTMFSANTALSSVIEILDRAKIGDEKDYQEFASKKAQFDLLQERTSSNSILDVSTFVAADGKVLNFSRSYPPPPISLADRDYFKYLSENNDLDTYYSTPVRNKGNGKWVFYLARRVNGKNGQFLGVVLVGVSVEVFSSLYERIGGNLGEGAALTLYRKDKTLLTRWPLVENLIGKTNPNTFIDDSLANVNVNGGVIFGSGPGFARQNDAPVERMLSYRAVKGYPLIVGAVVPETLYLANLNKNAIGVFMATGLSLIALAIGTYLLLRAYRRNAETQYRAHHDVLTELPNRTLFSDRLQQALAVCKRHQTKLAILFVDLDNLKTINDVYSHNAGDSLLKEVARRMRECVRESDTVGRLGGDEFVLILPGIDTEDRAVQVAEKIRLALSEPIEVEGISLSTSASIGVALYPEHGENETDLINNADVAMYEAKSSGRNQIKVFGEDVLKAALVDLA